MWLIWPAWRNVVMRRAFPWRNSKSNWQPMASLRIEFAKIQPSTNGGGARAWLLAFRPHPAGIRKVARQPPPGRLARVADPWWRWAASRTNVRPSPLPLRPVCRWRNE